MGGVKGEVKGGRVEGGSPDLAKHAWKAWNGHVTVNGRGGVNGTVKRCEWA